MSRYQTFIFYGRQFGDIVNEKSEQERIRRIPKLYIAFKANDLLSAINMDGSLYEN